MSSLRSAGILFMAIAIAAQIPPSTISAPPDVASVPSYPDVPNRWRMPDWDGAPPPFLTINYRWKNSTLRLFSVLTTLGTPLDAGLQELRIESFFPADDDTRTLVHHLT